MRARTKRFSVIGAALGLVLAAGVVVAPPAAPTASAAVGCSYFNGLKVTSNYVAINGIALKAGESITAKASPAATGDMILLSYSIGLSPYIKEAPASTGITFTAGTTSSYNLGWSFEAAGTRPSSITYSFTSKCSTSVTPTPTPTPTPTATTKPGKGKGKG
ncbi:hypothetical protein SAMN04487846_1576 [Microbacterium sp. cf046]|uniref:hypothetical protein n=1 Tax=Microbacterium sp. cf046 TaxID=1761803 RepID=UPI0008EEC050|nr:hypothetical protein [Microbacterium sp. cf046]SFS02448.1 hypothetical protein SAMN04487846_1576 [Microbacterium sp. cf046]